MKVVSLECRSVLLALTFYFTICKSMQSFQTMLRCKLHLVKKYIFSKYNWTRWPPIFLYKME